MIKVLRETDYQIINLENVKFYFRPMTYFDEIAIGSMSSRDGKTSFENVLDVVRYMLQNLLVKVEGLEFLDGQKFELETENGKVTEGSLNVLSTMGRFADFQRALLKLIGDDTDLLNADGSKVEGVEIIRTPKLIDTKKKK